jgi:hypothetical protein
LRLKPDDDWGPREPLSTLLELPDVKSRLQPSLGAAFKLLLVQSVEYLHAVAIVGGDPVIWTGDEPRRVPVCSALCERLEALTKGTWVDRRAEATLRRDEAIKHLLFGLAPPEPHDQMTWRWEDLLSFGHGVSTVRDDARFSQCIDDLLRFLADKAIVPSEVLATALELHVGSCPFLLEAIHLQTYETYGEQVDASGLIEAKETARILAWLVSMSADATLPEKAREAISVVAEVLTSKDRWNEPWYLGRRCDLLRNEQATAALFEALSSSRAIRRRLRLEDRSSS